MRWKLNSDWVRRSLWPFKKDSHNENQWTDEDVVEISQQLCVFCRISALSYCIFSPEIKMTVIHWRLGCKDRCVKQMAGNKKDNSVGNARDWASVKSHCLLCSNPPSSSYIYMAAKEMVGEYHQGVRHRAPTWRCLTMWAACHHKCCPWTVFCRIISARRCAGGRRS